jgi:hypothetical protein
VHGRLRTDIAKGGDTVVTMDDGGGNLTRDDLLEDGGHVGAIPRFGMA